MTDKDTRYRLAVVATTALVVVSGGSVLTACGSAQDADTSHPRAVLAELEGSAPAGYVAKSSGVTEVTEELIKKATPPTQDMQMWPEQCLSSFQNSPFNEVGSTVETVTFRGEGQVIIIGLTDRKTPLPSLDPMCAMGSFRTPGAEGLFRETQPLEVASVPAQGRQVVTLIPGGAQQSVVVSYTTRLTDTKALTLSVTPDLTSQTPRLVVDTAKAIELYQRAGEIARQR